MVPDLLKRNFMAERPNQKWVTDLTEFSLFGKKLYLSPIMDLYNREIISYNIAEHPTFYQTMKMLEDAIKDLPDTPELILHSDQGWQYQMKRYQYRLREKVLVRACLVRETVWIMRSWKTFRTVKIRIIIFAEVRVCRSFPQGTGGIHKLLQ